MSFILIPKHGEDLQVNAWNWRPTLLLLRDANLVDDRNYELMSANGCGAHADAETSARIADFLEQKLQSMQPGQRICGDLSLTDKPNKPIIFTPGMKVADVDAKEAYSATYEWLVMFRDFCRTSGGFKVS